MHLSNRTVADASLVTIAVVAVGYVLLIATGFKSFTMLPQVISLIDTFGAGRADAISPLHLLKIQHPHALRFIAVYPAIMITVHLNIPINVAFTAYLIPFLITPPAMIAWISGRVLSLSATHVLALAALNLVFFCLLSMGMNGRLILGFWGITAICCAGVFWLDDSRPRWAAGVAFLIPGLFFCSVTSGVFTVGFLLTCTFVASVLLQRIMQRTQRALYPIVLLGGGLIIASVPIMIRFLNKNLAFYGGKVSTMLDHGLGNVFFLAPISPSDGLILYIVIAGILASCAVTTWFACMAAAPALIPMVMLPFLSIAVGFFGYSALLTIMIAFVLLLDIGVIGMVGTHLLRTEGHPYSRRAQTADTLADIRP